MEAELLMTYADPEQPGEPWRQPNSLVDVLVPRVKSKLMPWLRRYWPKTLVIGFGFAAVLVAASLGLQSFDAQRDPVPVVKEYLKAIERGDATAANRMIAPVPDVDTSPLLSDKALGSAVERIKLEKVWLEEPAGDAGGPASTASVRATFSLAGKTTSKSSR